MGTEEPLPVDIKHKLSGGLDEPPRTHKLASAAAAAAERAEALAKAAQAVALQRQLQENARPMDNAAEPKKTYRPTGAASHKAMQEAEPLPAELTYLQPLMADDIPELPPVGSHVPQPVTPTHHQQVVTQTTQAINSNSKSGSFTTPARVPMDSQPSSPTAQALHYRDREYVSAQYTTQPSTPSAANQLYVNTTPSNNNSPVVNPNAGGGAKGQQGHMQGGGGIALSNNLITTNGTNHSHSQQHSQHSHVQLSPAAPQSNAVAQQGGVMLGTQPHMASNGHLGGLSRHHDNGNVVYQQPVQRKASAAALSTTNTVNMAPAGRGGGGGNQHNQHVNLNLNHHGNGNGNVQGGNSQPQLIQPIPLQQPSTANVYGAYAPAATAQPSRVNAHNHSQHTPSPTTGGVIDASSGALVLWAPQPDEDPRYPVIPQQQYSYNQKFMSTGSMYDDAPMYQVPGYNNYNNKQNQLGWNGPGVPHQQFNRTGGMYTPEVEYANYGHGMMGNNNSMMGNNNVYNNTGLGFNNTAPPAFEHPSYQPPSQLQQQRQGGGGGRPSSLSQHNIQPLPLQQPLRQQGQQQQPQGHGLQPHGGMMNTTPSQPYQHNYGGGRNNGNGYNPWGMEDELGHMVGGGPLHAPQQPMPMQHSPPAGLTSNPVMNLGGPARPQNYMYGSGLDHPPAHHGVPQITAGGYQPPQVGIYDPLAPVPGDSHIPSINCIVCGRATAYNVQRQSGFKCPDCIGTSHRKANEVQHQQLLDNVHPMARNQMIHQLEHKRMVADLSRDEQKQLRMLKKDGGQPASGGLLNKVKSLIN